MHADEEPPYSAQTIEDWLNGKPMSAREARIVERRLHLPMGWLDADHRSDTSIMPAKC